MQRKNFYSYKNLFQVCPNSNEFSLFSFGKGRSERTWHNHKRKEEKKQLHYFLISNSIRGFSNFIHFISVFQNLNFPKTFTSEKNKAVK